MVQVNNAMRVRFIDENVQAAKLADKKGRARRPFHDIAIELVTSNSSLVSNDEIQNVLLGVVHR